MICYHFEDQTASNQALHVSFLDCRSLSHVALPHTHGHFEVFLTPLPRALRRSAVQMQIGSPLRSGEDSLFFYRTVCHCGHSFAPSMVTFFT